MSGLLWNYSENIKLVYQLKGQQNVSKDYLCIVVFFSLKLMPPSIAQMPHPHPLENSLFNKNSRFHS